MLRFFQKSHQSGIGLLACAQKLNALARSRRRHSGGHQYILDRIFHGGIALGFAQHRAVEFGLSKGLFAQFPPPHEQKGRDRQPGNCQNSQKPGDGYRGTIMLPLDARHQKQSERQTGDG